MFIQGRAKILLKEMGSEDGETMKIETVVLLKNNFSFFYLREITKYSQRSLENK